MVEDSDGVVWLTPKEAAEYLGLSLSRLYHIKTRLTHWKGKKMLLFRKDRLLGEYMNSYN